MSCAWILHRNQFGPKRQHVRPGVRSQKVDQTDGRNVGPNTHFLSETQVTPERDTHESERIAPTPFDEKPAHGSVTATAADHSRQDRVEPAIEPSERDAHSAAIEDSSRNESRDRRGPEPHDTGAAGLSTTQRHEFSEQNPWAEQTRVEVNILAASPPNGATRDEANPVANGYDAAAYGLPMQGLEPASGWDAIDEMLAENAEPGTTSGGLPPAAVDQTATVAATADETDSVENAATGDRTLADQPARDSDWSAPRETLTNANETIASDSADSPKETAAVAQDVVREGPEADGPAGQSKPTLPQEIEPSQYGVPATLDLLPDEEPVIERKAPADEKEPAPGAAEKSETAAVQPPEGDTDDGVSEVPTEDRLAVSASPTGNDVPAPAETREPADEPVETDDAPEHVQSLGTPEQSDVGPEEPDAASRGPTGEHASPDEAYSYVVSDARFEVANGELRLKQGIKLDSTKEPTVDVLVATIDSEGESAAENYAITVGDNGQSPEPIPLNDPFEDSDETWAELSEGPSPDVETAEESEAPTGLQTPKSPEAPEPVEPTETVGSTGISDMRPQNHLPEPGVEAGDHDANIDAAEMKDDKLAQEPERPTKARYVDSIEDTFAPASEPEPEARSEPEAELSGDEPQTGRDFLLVDPEADEPASGQTESPAATPESQRDTVSVQSRHAGPADCDHSKENDDAPVQDASRETDLAAAPEQVSQPETEADDTELELFLFGAEDGTNKDGESGSPQDRDVDADETLDLSDVSSSGRSWTIVLDDGSEITGTGEDYLDLTEKASGTITFDDGTEMTFDSVERVTW